MSARHWLVVFVVAIVAAAAAPAAVQVNRATISGTVSDPSAAAVPGVAVTITGENGGVLG